MSSSEKRELEEDGDTNNESKSAKSRKVDLLVQNAKFSDVSHGKGRLIPKHILAKLSREDIDLLQNTTSSCPDIAQIQETIKLRRKYNLGVKLPDDIDDSSYYIDEGLRKVYPYYYLYQSFAKRRWLGRKLRDVLKEEFRDISEDQLKFRFDSKLTLVNGNQVKFDYVIRSNDFITNRNHRHELPVLATPIKIIHDDKDTLVIDKPPSMPIHPCGRYRHNSVMNILEKEYNYKDIKVVHRLDRLVSGVLIIAKNAGRANVLENMIKAREVQKEYICRVVGEFPLGSQEDDGYITVDKPLDIMMGKVALAIVDSKGKPSTTKFKRLNYNGKTSTVLCKPLTGRMHQIRVHLQYLGHPIVNDNLYNSDAFGPERGKGANYGKSMKQLSLDVIAQHRESAWMITSDNDLIDMSSSVGPTKTDTSEQNSTEETTDRTVEFLSEDEKRETMAALEHYFTKDSWKDLGQRWSFDATKWISDPSCLDCATKYHDPPLRRLFLYLHAFRYAGTGWCYESEMPNWARESWMY